MNRWDDKSLPKHGWECLYVEDLKEDQEDSPYANCGMCGREKIRFVHHLTHSSCNDEIASGCICAGKLTGDADAAKERESLAKNKTERRRRWLKRKWKTSVKGNPWLRVDGTRVTIFPKGSSWSFSVGDEFSREYFDTVDQAKIQAFERLYELGEEWKKSPFCSKAYYNKNHASWGAFFAEAGWNAEYLPQASGRWQPTFLLKGSANNCYVHVETEYKLNDKIVERRVAEISPSVSNSALLIVGERPFIDNHFDHPMLGWTNGGWDNNQNPLHSFDLAAFISTMDGSIDFCHSSDSYSGKLSGYYEGGHWPLSCYPLSLWQTALAKLK